MKRLITTLISCFILLNTAVGTPALAEAKEAVSNIDTNALQDVFAKTSTAIQDVLNGATTSATELMSSGEMLLSEEDGSTPVPADSVVQNVQDSGTVASNLDGVVWDTEHTTCLIEDGFTIDAASLAEEIFPYKTYMTTFSAGANTRLTGDASGLFHWCTALTTVELSDSFDVSAVTNMSNMFQNCSRLPSLTLPNSFAPTAATSMSGMFSDCSSLTSLTLGNGFTPSSVTDMSSMFANSGLTSLTLPDAFVPSAATNMSHMFSGCGALTSLTLPATFAPTAVTDMSYMFSGSGFTSLTLPDSFVPSAASTMSYMFSSCSNLASLTLPATFAPSEVTDMSYMFAASKFTSLTLPDSFVPSKVQTMASMFKDRTALTSFALPATFSAPVVKDLSGMFYNCSELESLTLPDAFAPTQVTTMSGMFCQCSRLASLIFPDTFTPTAVENLRMIFLSCSALTSVKIPEGFTPIATADLQYMFKDCSSLTSIKLPSSFGTATAQTTGIFDVAEVGSSALALRSLTLPKGYKMTILDRLPGIQSQGEYKNYWTTSVDSCVNYGTTVFTAVENINNAIAQSSGSVTFTNVNVALGFNANGGRYATTSADQVTSQNEDETKYIFGNTNSSIAPSDIPVPKLTGHVLAGWSDSPVGDVIATPSTFPSRDSFYYAKWSTAVTVTFNANQHGTFGGDKETLDIDCAAGEKLTLPGADDLTVADGYVLLGWFTQASGGTQVTDQTDCPTTATTYYAHYDIILTFSSGDGTWAGGVTTQTVQNTPGAAIKLPTTDPTRTGYTFAGYGNPDVAPDTPKTYTATWDAITYTHTFNANGHGTFTGGGTTTTVNTTYGNKLNLPAASALTPETGYVFVGWYTQASGGTQVDSNTDCPAANTTYYAHYDIILTFNSGDGTWAGGVTTQTVQNTPGAAIKLPTTDPTRTGYTFAGYGNPDVAPDTPKTYTATWDAITYTHTFNANGHGTFAGGGTTTTVNTTYGNKLNLPAASALTPETGYVFVGWYTQASGGTQVDSNTDCPAANTTYYAHYDIILTFSSGDGTWSDGVTTQTVQNTPGAAIKLPTTDPTRTGYTFAGYGNPDVAPDAPKTYTATWSAVTYTHTFNANGHGTFSGGGTTTTVNTTYGNKLNLPAAGALTPETGYVFVGWYTLASGGTLVDSNTDCPAANTTYYAHYDIILTFNSGDGSWAGGVTTQTVQNTPGAAIKLPTTDPTRTGYTFAGYGNPDVAPDTPKTYTATWDAITYTHTFNANGHGTFTGGGTTTTVNTTYGNKLNLPAAGALTPETGYVFVGWYTQASGGTQVDSNTDCPAANTTYYAHYEALAAWATIENGTLELFWGQKPASTPTFAVSGPYSEQNPAPWQAYAQDIHTVDIDASLKDSPFAPASYASYFENLTALTQIEGLSNLNMQNAITLERMFAGCSQLEDLDLSGLNTVHVTNMDNMFQGCSTADKLILSKETPLQSGMGLPGFDNSTNPFWISSITHALTYGTDDETSVANINALLASLPEGGTQTLRLATMRLTYEANGGSFPVQCAENTTKSTVADGTTEESYLYGNPGEEIDESPTGGPNYTPIPVRAGYEYLGYAATPDATIPDTPVVFPGATFKLQRALTKASDGNTTFYAVWRNVEPGPTPPAPASDTDAFPLTGDATTARAALILCVLAGVSALFITRALRRHRTR